MRSLSTSSTSSSSGTPAPSGLTRQNSTSLTGKLGALPANLDDMKVGGRPKVGESSQPRAHAHGRQSRAAGRAELQTRVSSGRGTWNLFKACLALVETSALSW